MQARGTRHLKGMVVIDLVKFLKSYEKTGSLGSLSAPVEKLFTTRLLGSSWYELEPFLALLHLMNKVVLKSDEGSTLRLATTGGMHSLRTVYRAYATEGDVRGSVCAMRHAWAAMYDFGELHVEQDDEHSVGFRVDGYDDLAMPHAMMIAGWGLAAARVGGSTDASAQILNRPWAGGGNFRYQIRF